MTEAGSDYESRIQISDSRDAGQLIRRIRNTVSKELTSAQLMSLLNSFADLIVHNFPSEYLNNEMGERFLGILTPDQKVDIIGSYNCYEINLAEAATHGLFVKSGKVVAGLILPVLEKIRDQIVTFDTTGTSAIEQKLFILNRLNQILSNNFIKKLFETLHNTLSNEDRAAHANCGGRIIMFTKYFKAS
ncbi:hypothetical protein FO519_000016 [Halicephalobus sp. NKZ332]|nr:hypothetical protein FO519_000016 [Halicephalobus sp. NKZ332]